MITEKDIIKILTKHSSIFDQCIPPEDFKYIARSIMGKIEKETTDSIRKALNAGYEQHIKDSINLIEMHRGGKGK